MEPLTQEQKINAYNSYMQKNGIQRELTQTEKAQALNGAIEAGDSGGTEEAPTQASAGVDIMGALSNVASGAWETLKDTNVLPIKDFKGNTLKFGDLDDVAGNALGEIGSVAKGIWSPTESETYKSLSQAYDVAKADPASFAMQAPVALAKGAYDDLLLGGIGTAKQAPLSTFSLGGKAPAVAGKVLKSLAKAGKTGGKMTLSRLSGVPEDLLSDIAGIRRQGKNTTAMQSFEDGLNNASTDEFTQKIQNYVGRDLPEEGIRKRNEAFSKLEMPPEGFDSVQLLVDLNDKLERKGIKMKRDGIDFTGSIISENESAQNKVLKMMDVLSNKIRSNDMDGIQRGLDEAWSIVESVPYEQKKVRQILTDVWGNYREAIGEQVPGFNELKTVAKQGIDKLKGYRRGLFGNTSEKSLQETINSGAANKSLVAAIDHMWSNNANRDVQRKMVDDLSQFVKKELGEDVDLKRTAGGLRVASGTRNNWAKTLDGVLAGGGLTFGIQQALQGDFVSMLGTMAGTTLATILSSATVQNPRVAANIAKAFGASEGVADRIADNVRVIKNAAEKRGLNIEGLSAGAALTFLAGGDIDNEPAKPTMTELLSRAQQQRSMSGQPAQ